jgi:hypothetical protein
MDQIRQIPEYSDEEKAFLWASAKVREEDEKEQQAKIKAGRKGRR